MKLIETNDANITGRTTGLLSPYRSPSTNTRRSSAGTRRSCNARGVNPTSGIRNHATKNSGTTSAARTTYGMSRRIWPNSPPPMVPASIAAPNNICPRENTRSSGSVERRDPHERRESPAAPRDGHIEERGHEQRAEAEQQRYAPAQRVGHDAGGDLEHHRSDGERGVREQHLLDVEPGAHLEERIDAPDERHRQVEESCDDVVGPDDRTGAHAATIWLSVQALRAVAVRMTAPPTTASGPGVSPCASQAHTGLSTGSTKRNSEASSAGTRVMARDRNT